MKKAVRLLFGIVCMLLGTANAIWIGYNLFVEQQPSAEGRNPLPAIIFTLVLFYVGVRQFRQARRSD